jgi:hypothetical protein
MCQMEVANRNVMQISDSHLSVLVSYRSFYKKKGPISGKINLIFSNKFMYFRLSND